MKQILIRGYYIVRTWWPVWMHIVNGKNHRSFMQHHPQLDAFQKKIVSDLITQGISVTSLDELAPGKNLLKTLTQYLRPSVEKARSEDLYPVLKKKFLRDLWDPYGPIDLDNPFQKLALSERVLSIANSYLQMYAQFKYATMQITMPVPVGSEAIQSQRWHRDPQEKRMCKMFIYLNDVDEGAGPFTYVYGSTYGNKYGGLFAQKTPMGNYPPIGEVEKNIVPKDIHHMTGGAGTVIFCDTSGLHRGGYATKTDRLMFTSFYSAPSYTLEAPWYSFPSDFEEQRKNLGRQARRALKS